jgi:hypothetical protein
VRPRSAAATVLGRPFRLPRRAAAPAARASPVGWPNSRGSGARLLASAASWAPRPATGSELEARVAAAGARFGGSNDGCGGGERAPQVRGRPTWGRGASRVSHVIWPLWRACKAPRRKMAAKGPAMARFLAPGGGPARGRAGLPRRNGSSLRASVAARAAPAAAHAPPAAARMHKPRSCLPKPKLPHPSCGPFATRPAVRASRLLRESRQRLTIPEADEERWPGYAAAEAHDVPSTSGKDLGCPVFVMLPLDTVWVVERDGKRVRPRAAGVGADAGAAAGGNRARRSLRAGPTPHPAWPPAARSAAARPSRQRHPSDRSAVSVSAAHSPTQP